MSRLSLFSLLLPGLLALASCTSDPEKKAPPQETAPVADTSQLTAPGDTANAILSEIKQTNVANGKVLYEANCLRCHGPNGMSIAAGVPNLAEGGCPKRELRGMIYSGKGLMPSFKDQLTSQEIGQVVNYVLELREMHAVAKSE
jgi:cytochrome c6